MLTYLAARSLELRQISPKSCRKSSLDRQTRCALKENMVPGAFPTRGLPKVINSCHAKCPEASPRRHVVKAVSAQVQRSYRRQGPTEGVALLSGYT